MNLIYMARPVYGGWITFTAHYSLINNYPIFKIGNRTEKTMKNFGYNVKYKLSTIEDICSKENIIITALDKTCYKYLDYFPENTKLIIHDPNELKKKKYPNILIESGIINKFKIITLRENVHKYLKDTLGIDNELMFHPFYKYDKNNYESMNNYAVSISRIDYDKNIDILLKCNLLINDLNKKIKIFGFENRMYIHHKLKEYDFYNNWMGRFDKSLPMLYNDKDILKNCKFLIDLSIIKNDGGGVQYTLLEGIYNNCILILHKEWINKSKLFIHNYNCLAVDNENELKEILENNNDYSDILENSQKILLKHIQ